jgi:hypothetical protein
MDNCHAEVLQQLFVNLGLGVLRSAHPESDWPIYVTLMADVPDNAICVHETAAQLDGRMMATGELLEHKGFQVMVRAKTHEAGFAKAEAFRIAMDQSVHNNTVILGSHIYGVQSITRRSGILSLGRDVSSSERQLFTINGIVYLRQQS